MDWQAAFVILLIINVIVGLFGGTWLWMYCNDRYREGWADGRAAERDEWHAKHPHPDGLAHLILPHEWHPKSDRALRP